MTTIQRGAEKCHANKGTEIKAMSSRPPACRRNGTLTTDYASVNRSIHLRAFIPRSFYDISDQMAALRTIFIIPEADVG